MGARRAPLVKRPATIAKSRPFADRHKYRAFVAGMETRCRAIVDHVVPGQPAKAAQGKRTPGHRLSLLESGWAALDVANVVVVRLGVVGKTTVFVFAAFCGP